MNTKTPALNIPARALGERLEFSFVPMREAQFEFEAPGRARFVADHGEWVYLTAPAARSFAEGPRASVLELGPRRWYEVVLDCTALDGGAQLYVLQYNEEREIDRDVFHLNPGPSRFRFRVPGGSTRVLLALRLRGGTALTVGSLSIEEAAAPQFDDVQRRQSAGSKTGIAGRGRLPADFEVLGRKEPVDLLTLTSKVKVQQLGEYSHVALADGQAPAMFSYPRGSGKQGEPLRTAWAVRPGHRYRIRFFIESSRLDATSVSVLILGGTDKLANHTVRARGTEQFFEFFTPEHADRAVVTVVVRKRSVLRILTLSVEDLGEQVVARSGSDMPRVLMVVLNDIAHDNRVLKSASTLAKAGYHVRLVGMSRGSEVDLHQTYLEGLQATILPNPATMLTARSARGIAWQHTVAYVAAEAWLIAREFRPEFIHTHDYHGVPVGAEVLRQCRLEGIGAAWFHDFHEFVLGYDHMEMEWQQAILDTEERYIALMDHRFTVSPTIAESLRDLYRLDQEPTVVLNAPALEPLHRPFERTIRGDVGLEEGQDLIVYTGGVSALRGLHTVVDALALNDSWYFAIVTNNSGPYVDGLLKAARERGYEDRIFLLPYVKPHQVAMYVRDASIGIMPFTIYGNTDASLPNKLFDYLHAELPMVATSCTLLRRFLEGWKVGAVFEPENVKGCAAAITDVLARQDVIRSTIRSRPELLRECTWDAQEHKILEAYRHFSNTPRQRLRLYPEDFPADVVSEG